MKPKGIEYILDFQVSSSVIAEARYDLYNKCTKFHMKNN